MESLWDRIRKRYFIWEQDGCYYGIQWNIYTDIWNHINIDHISDNTLFLQIYMIITLFLIRHNI